jgi:hypothetical protein
VLVKYFSVACEDAVLALDDILETVLETALETVLDNNVSDLLLDCSYFFDDS